MTLLTYFLIIKVATSSVQLTLGKVPNRIINQEKSSTTPRPKAVVADIWHDPCPSSDDFTEIVLMSPGPCPSPPTDRGSRAGQAQHMEGAPGQMTSSVQVSLCKAKTHHVEWRTSPVAQTCPLMAPRETRLKTAVPPRPCHPGSFLGGMSFSSQCLFQNTAPGAPRMAVEE